MQKRTRSRTRSRTPSTRQPLHSASGTTRSTSPIDPLDPNHNRGETQAMSSSLSNSTLEPRRKPTSSKSSLMSPTSATSETAHEREQLMSRSTFSLDDAVPLTHTHFTKPDTDDGGSGNGPAAAEGFLTLPPADQRNFCLLVLLYFLQGIPLGLATGSVPFLLKNHLSYSQMGVYSLASYPYSLKLLWSPIVDAVWNKRLGRRKSWILPMQTISGIGMMYLGAKAEGMMTAAEGAKGGGGGVWGFTGWWFALVFMCATQDIAVDGWALTLLSAPNLAYASTAQTVGLTAGQFLSHTVFLAFNSKDFANKWFRTLPGEQGLVTLGGYLTFAGVLYLVITLGLAVFNREERSRERSSIMDVYKIMGSIMKLKNIQTLVVVHLIAKVGFVANDAVTNLKLLEKGFGQEDLALTVLIDFPFELVIGYYAGQWSDKYGAMRLWSWAFVGRLGAAIFAQFTVSIFPAGGTTSWYLLLVIFEHVYSTFMSQIMFVTVCAFHAKISDPVIGGTYMTLLATVSNLGGTFPRIFALKFVDMFTTATCHPPRIPPSDFKGELIQEPFSCALESDRHLCSAGGGTCRILTDGYYVINIACIILGAATFWMYIRPAVSKLQSLPRSAWRVPH